MALPTSGQISVQQIANEKENVSLPQAKENISLRGLSKDSVDDYTRAGSTAIDITVNADSVASSAHGGPDGGTSDGGHKVSEFYGYDQDFVATTFNGAGIGQGSFSLATANLVPASNGHPNFDMNTSGTASINNSWEMQNRDEVANPPPGVPSSNSAALSTATIRIGNDQTNNRIIILLLKDGSHAVQAGGLSGGSASYRILPYVGLANATWTAKIEYNSNSNGYDSTNSTIGTYNGTSSSTLSYSTSSTYHTAPTADTFLSIPAFTGMAANGDSLITDGSSRSFTWSAKVPGNLSNYSANTGSGTVQGGFTTTECRVTIKAVDGSDTYESVSSYWDIGLSAQKGGIF